MHYFPHCYRVTTDLKAGLLLYYIASSYLYAYILYSIHDCWLELWSLCSIYYQIKFVALLIELITHMIDYFVGRA